ncbi:YbaB/EbfC family nucleoid-associated protein [Angustibacter sp. McL0619]|uniref:YbaB/EbfC family nucleoid-associated protein n=1 Tax=Angustibacter sp. McL0619 TaxID=3415676 RepID=UPI003CFAAB85
MPTPEDEAVEAAMARLAQTRRSLDRLQKETLEAETTVRSPCRRLGVTVGAKGDLRAVRFYGETYRSLPPAELGTLVVQTVGRARQQALEQAQKALDEILPQSSLRLDGGAGGLDEMLERFLGSGDYGLGDADRAMFRRSWAGES